MSHIDYHEGRILETLQGALDGPIRNPRSAIKRRPGSWARGVESILRELGV